MTWYQMEGKDQDILLYSRVSFVRNVHGIPFSSKMELSHAHQIIEDVGAILTPNGFTPTDFQSISRINAYALLETQYIPPDFIQTSLPHVLYLHHPCQLSVALCGSEHIHIQAIQAGLSLMTAYESAAKIQDMLDAHIPFAFDEHIGYLTSTPSLAGSGMTASATLLLPMLHQAKEIAQLIPALSRMGITLWHLTSNTPHEDIGLYHVSITPAWGMPETDAIQGLTTALQYLIERERELRHTSSEKQLDACKDRAKRALGLLTNAYMLPSLEALRLLTDLRLGVAMGVMDGIPYSTLTTLMIQSMSASLTLACQTPPKDARERRIKRAELIREKLSGNA